MSRSPRPARARPCLPLPVFGRVATACVLVFLLLSALPARGAPVPDYEAPERIEGVSRVDAETLIELASERPDLVVIDARMRDDRRHGYVEGSVSLPDIETNCKTLAEQVPSLTTPVLFYCNGVKCFRSADAVKVARSCGYRNIYWFRGGFEEWISKGYPYLTE